MIKLTRMACMAVIAFAATMMLTETGWSYKLSGTHSAGEIKSKCDAAGGTFNQDPEAGYSCQVSITGGSVYCTNKGQCSGACPKCPAVAKGINGILGPPASAGTASAAGGTATNKKPPLHNVNQPVVVQHPGGTRSGGSKH